ncbi:MAG: hypothetical protein KDH92_09215, partial [Chloroflexi bacterium]|nr:hypothetical protein [Chloroflexota bacterium]
MPSPSWRAAARDLGSLVALLLLALLLRLPRLDSIPRYTDETGEVATALDIAFEGARPLVHNDAYRGPVWAYGLAGALRLFGPQPGLPRRYALTLSVLTVLATWALARGLVGPRAGWVAGLLQASAFAPIALESHVAWSNHATPLVVTLAALATWRGAGASVTDPQPAPAEAPVSGRQAPGFDSGHPVSGPATGRQGPGGGADRWLLLAGLLWGLALQTHPSVVAPLAGAGLWLLLRPGFRARLRRPAPYLALGLFLLALGPLIVHNLSSLRSTGDLASVEDATAESQPVNRDFGVASLAGNLVA